MRLPQLTERKITQYDQTEPEAKLYSCPEKQRDSQTDPLCHFTAPASHNGLSSVIGMIRHCEVTVC